MTNRHDGPRPGSEVTVIQSAKPTRLTQAEADELHTLIEAALRAKFNWTYAVVESGSGSKECQDADKADREAYGALYSWQREHGLEPK